MSDLVAVTKSENKLHMLGGIMDNQMFTPQQMQECAKMPSLLTQHMVLSRTLTQLQSSLRDNLMRNQQTLSGLLGRIDQKT